MVYDFNNPVLEFHQFHRYQCKPSGIRPVRQLVDVVGFARQLADSVRILPVQPGHPKEGSYTNYLFDKGIDKILKKVGEEATEIVIAAKNPDNEEVKYEMSDFLYHMMVLMVEKGLTWEDITRELSQR